MATLRFPDRVPVTSDVYIEFELREEWTKTLLGPLRTAESRDFVVRKKLPRSTWGLNRGPGRLRPVHSSRR